MSQNRYSRTHSYSTSDTYGFSSDYSTNLADEDDIELDDDEFLSDGYDDDLMHSEGGRNNSEYDSSQYIRRAHHNRLEQKRRAFIRDSYTDLKDVMPEYKGKKLSRANILINVRRKIEDNQKRLNGLRREYEAKKAENDREEREVMNLERQLSSVDGNGGYMSEVQHSTPPLANIGINLVSVVHRPIVNRPTLLVQNQNAHEFSDENSPADGSKARIGSSVPTPTNGSLADSPVSSNNPTAQQSSDSSEDQVDGIKSSPSLSAASHLAPLSASPSVALESESKTKIQKDACSKLPESTKTIMDDEVVLAPPQEEADKKIQTRPIGLAMTTRRMRSCSMSLTKQDPDETIKNSPGAANSATKRSFTAAQPQATKRICVTAIGGSAESSSSVKVSVSKKSS